MQIRLDELNKKSEDPQLWDNKIEAQKVLKEKSVLEEKLNNYLHIASNLRNYLQYFELASAEGDNQLLSDIKNNLQDLKKISDSFEVECLFAGENDINNCFIDINAGAGGTDSCDFAFMLLRMYERFANIKNFKAEIISMIDGDEAGVRSATLKITGRYAFGWLKTESGVHRLVRISPFNANGKRQTSFA